MLRLLGSGLPRFERARVAAAFVGGGWRDASTMLENHWYAADDLAGRLGLGKDVRASLYQTFERWDGKGVAEGTKGEAILMTARLVNTADVVEVFHRSDGVEAAVAVARRRRGTQFDPALVDLVEQDAAVDLRGSRRGRDLACGDRGCAGRDELADGRTVRPGTGGVRRLHRHQVALHARALAQRRRARGCRRASVRARRAMRASGSAALASYTTSGGSACRTRSGTSRGALAEAEEERVRLHPYLSRRMLAASAALAPLGAIAIQHHERLDGSGYPRGLCGDAVDAERTYPRRSRRLRWQDRGAAAPARARARRRCRGASDRGTGRSPRQWSGRMRCCDRPATA